MNLDDAVRAARVFKALGHPVRLTIVRELARGRELSTVNLRELFHRSQPTMTEHFLKLVRAGLLHVRQAGKRNYYTLDRRLFRRHGITL